ncbi:oocyte zinc finger protein XlCOF7.1-like isoform X2 [Corythoichthys intestinalis]|uniref:oocyte zinc finger protein XlCOF7.1-like isoform X2 n=1 Tax=Corythoichthys intestinalis TaxID=161448 RepID=UPI0025A623F2|nr:oocyte zinc finger protein XlCOF7.1-like isoform X2 [Corythoichthys intestinalis]
MKKLHPQKHDPLPVEQEESEMPYIKQEEEPEPSNIKEENQEHEIPKFPMTVSVKSEEDEVPSKESGVAKPSSDSSFQHLTTKGEARSQPDGLLAPLSDSEDVTSQSSDYNTDKEDVDVDGSKSLKKSSLKRERKDRADVTVEDFHPEKYDPHHVEQEESVMPYNKQEAEPETPSIKEEQEDKIPKFSMTRSVKSEEDEGPSEESRAEQLARSNLFQYLIRKGEGQSQPDDLLAPLSDSDDVTSQSSDLNTDEEDVGFDASKSLKKSSLKRDGKERAGGKPCSHCDSTFTTNQRLILHTRTHTGEKPFVCTFCGKRFTQKGTLNVHKRTHTGEKPFVCSICDKRCSTKSTLTKHTRTHTGEKPFVCTFCGNRFTQTGNLKRHERKYHLLKSSTNTLDGHI